MAFGAGIAVGALWNNNYWNWGTGAIYPPVWAGYSGWRGNVNNGNVNIRNNVNLGNVGINVKPWQPNGDYRPGMGSKPGIGAIDDGPNGEKILRVGKNGWTLPLPLIKTDAGWRFDVAKGKEEMTSRRVGYNELSAIEACKAYVSAQDEYFRLDRDANGLREYARRFISTPGTHDGLYWPPENQADISPLDGFAENANLAERSGEKPEPYMGYYFRILTAQGPAAPGGAFSYLINGHMIAGHAMVAWPAAYGDSGVETFVCGENGIVYQKDLGPNTAALGASMAQYNPDASWKVVE